MILADDLRNRCSERLLIMLIESAEPLDDEGVLDGGDDRLDARRLEQSRSLPVSDLHLSEGCARSHLTGHCHDDPIGSGIVVGRTRDDYRGPLLGGRLIGKRKRNQDDVAEAIAGRRRHRLRCPRHVRRRLPRTSSLRG